MRLSLVGIVFVMFAIAPPSSMAENANPPAPTRSQSMIDTFQVMCTIELPDFERIDAKATALRMRPEADSKLNARGDAVFRNKSWFGNLTTGPFVLLLDETTGPKGKATSCAIVGEVPDVDAFRANAIEAMRLPAEAAPEMGSDGSRSFVWDRIFGPATTLIVRDFKPAGKPGVMLKLISAEKPR
jgi:hypothetical protein